MALRLAGSALVLTAVAALACSNSPRTEAPAKQLAAMSAPRRDALSLLRAVQSTSDPHFALTRSGDAFVGVEATSAPLRFDARGVHLPSVDLRLARLGRGTLKDVAPVPPSGDKNRVAYRYQGVEEWYQNGPAGLEQGFELAERPAGSGALVLECEVGGARAKLAGDHVDLTTDAGNVATIRELYVVDADGHEVPARFGVKNGAFRIEIDDDGAHYPLSVDPLIGIATLLKASEGSVQDSGYGFRVRARGDRIIIGAYKATVGSVAQAGAAYIYARSGTSWVEEAKIVSPAPTMYEQFGLAVDIENDTAVSASWQYNAQRGIAWVYKRTGTTWSHHGTLTIAGALGGIGFGRAVGLDGGRLAVAASGNRRVHLFTTMTTGASPVATLISPETSAINYALGFAFQGGTIAVGVPDFSGTTGYIEVYEGSGTSYSYKQKLTYAGKNFGSSVDIDGTSLIAYAQTTATPAQAVAPIFTRGASTWAVSSTLSSPFYYSPNGVGAVSISGNVAIVSGTSAATNTAAAAAFTRSTGGTWSLLSNLDLLGTTGVVANDVNIDGDTAVVGVHQNNTDTILRSGAAVAFHPIVAWPNGHTCTDARQCNTGLCVDGYCCNTACTESCKACSVTGALGTCTAVPPGAPVGGRMCSPSKVCAAGGVCSSACTTTTDCAAGFFCSAGTCTAKKANGAGCSTASECTSGFCADGVCCNVACTGQCEACDVSGKGGTCSPVLGAPHGGKTACAGATSGSDKDCASSCNGVDPTKCYYPSTTAACGGDTCTAGVETKVGKCDGAGNCLDTSRMCSPYACGTAACKTACTTKTDCAAGNSCKGGACVPSDSLGAPCTSSGDCLDGLYCTDGVCCGVVDCGADKSCSAKETAKGTCFAKKGASCTADAECASGFCVDGTCCDTRCDGQCEACDLSGDGTCGPVTGSPHGARPACGTGSDVCSAPACDGVTRTSCAGFKAGPSVVCKPAECDGESLEPEATCDGKGACGTPAASSCGKYKCDPTAVACRTSCATSDDCAAGFSCNGGVCSTGATCSEDGLSSIGPDGTKPCGAYRCGADGNCRGDCGSSADCAPGNVCDTASKTCAGAPAASGGTDDGGGCALPRDRRTSGGAAVLLFAVAGLGLVSRRRSVR